MNKSITITDASQISSSLSRNVSHELPGACELVGLWIFTFGKTRELSWFKWTDGAKENLREEIGKQKLMNEDGGSRDERDASQPEARKFHQSCTRPNRCDARHEREINFLAREVMRKFLNSKCQEFMSGFIYTV